MKYEDRSGEFSRRIIAFLIVLCCVVSSAGADKKFTSLDKLTKRLTEKSGKKANDENRIYSYSYIN